MNDVQREDETSWISAVLRLVIQFLVVAAILAATVYLLFYPAGWHGVAVQVRRELKVFVRAVRVYNFVTDSLPPPTLRDTLDAMKKLSATSPLMPEFQFDQFPMVERGTDAWGHPLKYVVDHSQRSVLIRSIGKNGIDEAGAGDDIEIREVLRMSRV